MPLLILPVLRKYYRQKKQSVSGRQSWQNLIPTFRNCREMAGRVFLFLSFHLVCYRIFVLLATRQRKKNSWKNLIFHIFCFINKLCKMRKFAKFTLVISHVRLVCDIYCAHAYLCRYHSALFCFRKMKLRGLIFLINCGSNLTINIVKRGKKMKSK